ncbi:MAG: MarR family winged helix-turn-helix transcriptional regulator [Acidimicrobiales bacterium]
MNEAEDRRAATADRVWRRLAQLHHHLEAELGRGLGAHGLSHPDYLVLATLDEVIDGRRRLVELARDLGWEKSRTSHHIARMCARGLVTKSTCPTDRRGAFVVLTDQGRRARARAAPHYLADVRRLLGSVTPTQLAALEAVANVVLARADDQVTDGSPAPPSAQ